MEQHQSFVRMMARKKKLGKVGEGTSSPAQQTGSTSTVTHRSVNPALKVVDTQIPATDTKPINPEAAKGETKRKTQETSPSPPKRRKRMSPCSPDHWTRTFM